MPTLAPTQHERAARFLDLVAYVSHLSHPFLACRICQVAVPLTAIPIHFSKLKIHNFRQRDVQLLLQAWIELCLPTQPVLLNTVGDLETWPYPANPPYPPPLQILPVQYALHCTYRDPATGARCNVVQRLQQEMVKHCCKEHGWVNPITRGRPFLATASATHSQMWEKDVPCQRLRLCGVGSRAFRVSVDTQAAKATPMGLAKTRKEKTWEELEAELNVLQSNSTAQTPIGIDASAQYPIHMSPWLEKTGWPAYLEGQNLESVSRLLAPPSHDEPSLKALLQAFDNLINEARESVLSGEVNVFALHRVNSFMPGRPFRKPFHSKILESTYKRYKSYWHRLLIYVCRLTSLQCSLGLHYVLTSAQQHALHHISIANSQLS
jgi:hypothetical protein